jgi:hypothetical protein
MAGVVQNIPAHRIKAQITAGILRFVIFFFLSELDSGVVVYILGPSPD